MGEPAALTPLAKSQARELARQVIRAIRNDESIVKVVFQYLAMEGYDQGQILDQAMYLLSATILDKELQK